MNYSELLQLAKGWGNFVSDRINIWRLRNIRNINRIIGNNDPDGKVAKLLDFTDRKGQDIADPWYTGNFDVTYDDVKEGCEALLQNCLLRL